MHKQILYTQVYLLVLIFIASFEIKFKFKEKLNLIYLRMLALTFFKRLKYK